MWKTSRVEHISSSHRLVSLAILRPESVASSGSSRSPGQTLGKQNWSYQKCRFHAEVKSPRREGKRGRWSFSSWGGYGDTEAKRGRDNTVLYNMSDRLTRLHLGERFRFIKISFWISCFIWKSEIRISKSKSGSPNRMHPSYPGRQHCNIMLI